ncbi:MAG: hypothetical protein A3F46_05920 [Legionellales bacterium RIFCSPHIGHO2_12_FULL_42_9]|nr:MAG: hypothetical protein A3F46_05920 [Legionellales bacterium RIFCSPHIGHO2_12_FULL_42_9]
MVAWLLATRKYGNPGCKQPGNMALEIPVAQPGCTTRLQATRLQATRLQATRLQATRLQATRLRF